MENVAQNLRTRYNVETKILQFDFFLLVNQEGLDKLKVLLETITEDVSLLVNNVGQIINGPFHE